MSAMHGSVALLALLGAFAAQAGETTLESKQYIAAAAPSAAMIDEDPNVLVVTAFQDEIITNGVVAALAGDARLSGRIGVEAGRGIVSLTGLVGTSPQIRRAARVAASVDGVREVQNLLRARVGPTN